MDTTTKNILIAEFWKGFVSNELLYRRIIDNGEVDIIDEILNKLIEIQRGLAVEFEKVKGLYVMTISADGIEENFDIIIEIVSNAPVIENWKFIAFRQPYDKDKLDKFVLTVNGYSLDPKKIMFLPIIEDEMLYIQIFSTDLNEENKNIVGYGCLMLLDNIIGEYDCVKKVSGYEYYNLTEGKEFESELRPLIQMREYLDTYNQDN